MDKSFFTDKNVIPTVEGLRSALRGTYQYWQEIKDYYTLSKYPAAEKGWKFPRENTGGAIG